MPAIRQISIKEDSFSFTDQTGVERTFDTSKIPPSQDSIAKLEDYINNVWLPPIIGKSYQMVVHIFNLSPLILTVYTANLKETIPLSWWLEPDDKNQLIDPTSNILSNWEKI